MDISDFTALVEYAESNKPIINQTVRPCKICGSDSLFYSDLDFNKTCGPVSSYFDAKLGIKVPYKLCQKCNFIFTEFFDNFTTEQWVRYIYNDAYYDSIDPEYNTIRPNTNMILLSSLLRSPLNGWLGLDYGGGSGLLSRLMVKKGYSFDSYDPYGTNTIKEKNVGKYNFCSSFEVAEHVVNPIAYINNILRFMNPNKFIILIGTEIHRKSILKGDLINWWYAAPRNGHISLYSEQSLAEIARQLSLFYYRFRNSTHIFYRGYSRINIARIIYYGKINNIIHRYLYYNDYHTTDIPSSN